MLTNWSHLSKKLHLKHCPDRLGWCRETHPYMQVAPSAAAQIRGWPGRREVTCLSFTGPALSPPSRFTLLLLLISLLIWEPTFAGFHHWLRTNSSPGTLQVFSTRLGLLRHLTLSTEQRPLPTVRLLQLLRPPTSPKEPLRCDSSVVTI